MASTVFNCQDMEKAGKELGSSLSGKLGTMTMSKLPQNIQNAITGLPVNKASAPIKTSGGIIVLMVCKRVKPKLPPKPKRSDRQKVHHSILNERLHAAARRFLRDLRNAALLISGYECSIGQADNAAKRYCRYDGRAGWHWRRSHSQGLAKPGAVIEPVLPY